MAASSFLLDLTYLLAKSSVALLQKAPTRRAASERGVVGCMCVCVCVCVCKWMMEVQREGEKSTANTHTHTHTHTHTNPPALAVLAAPVVAAVAVVPCSVCVFVCV
jgi:hypothetical protein